ncbi:mannosyltransferase [Ophidiomyces ophidiicola]|nr:mannosyltransferase [Ophidiomyces ophidiicola]
MITALLFLSWLLIAQLASCDADFMSVRTSMNTDYSGKMGDPADKYFHESMYVFRLTV